MCTSSLRPQLVILAVLLAVRPLAGAADVRPAALANNRFGLDLYGRLCTQDGNLFFSPFSVSTALALTYAGAAGTTARQMAGTMHWVEPGGEGRPWSSQDLALSLGGLIRDHNQGAVQGKGELIVANALWGQKDLTFLPDFVRLIETAYGGQLLRVDFAQDPEGARLKINTWVEDQTHQQIKDLVPGGALDRSTRLVLTNAVYFKGVWTQPFQKGKTQLRPFTCPGGISPEVSLMTQAGRFSYAEANDLQILDMPYAGQGLSLVILLPRRPDGLAKLEKALTAETLSAWLEGLTSTQVHVFVPRFRLSREFSLADTLRTMGMQDPFSGRADFSGVAGERNLFLSAVLHKAFVSVDEEGTEAAAATGAAMQLTSVAPSAKPVVFCANRPFVFIIRERVSGAILFMGRLVRPQPEG